MSHSLEGSSRLSQLRAEQSAAWEAGTPLRVEELLQQQIGSPQLTEDEELELICAEIYLRHERGEQPQESEYTQRFPQHAAALERQLAVERLLSDSLALSPTALSAASLSEASSLEPSRERRIPQLPGYRIVRTLGRGGMAIVYLAEQAALQRMVAIKMIRDSVFASDVLRQRFQSEALAVARLQHPYIVQIYDADEVDGVPYFALEYIAGGNLAEATRRQPQPWRAACEFVVKLCAALEHAHQHGIVHRDLKPANILLAPAKSAAAAPPASTTTFDLEQYEPKISDFGLAKTFTEGLDVTRSEAILGTCAYLSPEQAWGRSKSVGPASDLHALGLILYELLTGRAPFERPSFAETLDAVRFEVPSRPSCIVPDVPSALDDLLAICLSKEPEQRFPSATALAQALTVVLDEGPDAAIERRLPTSSPLSAVPNRSVSGSGTLTGRPATGEESATDTAAAALSPAGIDGNVGNRRRPVKIVAIAGALLLLVLLLVLPGRSKQEADRTRETSTDEQSATLATGSPTSPRTVGESFALLIGIRTYHLAGADISLEFTESDVDELSRLLFRQGFPRRNIGLLTQWSEVDNPSLAPTRKNIRSRLRQLLQSCIPADTVLVALTGMGGDLGTPPMYCFLPADGNPDQPNSMLSLAELYELFRECPAKQKLLLVDTCQTLVADQIQWPSLPTPPPGLGVFFACSPHQASYESSKLRHGIFSYHILRGLEGEADTNRDRVITVDELVTYTTEHVDQYVSRHFVNAAQRPRFVGSLPGATPLTPLQGNPSANK